MDRLALGLWSRGVSGFLPTLVPQPLDEMAATAARLSAWTRSRRAGDGRGAIPLGLHFEGPFVSAVRCGALHRSCFLDGSDLKTLDAFFEALGHPHRRGPAAPVSGRQRAGDRQDLADVGCQPRRDLRQVRVADVNELALVHLATKPA